MNAYLRSMKVAVISGASKGLGFAIAEKFIRENYHLAICSRQENELKAAADKLQALNPQSCILAIPCDLSDKNEVERFARQIQKTFTDIDVLVNNAGRFLQGRLYDEAEGQLETLLATNLLSAYHLTRALLPEMMKKKSGHIFNISSVAGLKPYAMGGSYSISKFALQGFSQNLRQELIPFGIKVTTVNPGATLSDSWKGSGVAEERIMKASDVAELIYTSAALSPQACVEDIVLRPLLGDL